MQIYGCLIVKNEENNLPRCLSSLKILTDKILIADTGSTDRTKEIAVAYEALVFDFTWQNDFSLARNFILEKATGDWIIFLDADEYLADDDAGRLKSILETIDKQPEFDSLLIRIYNFGDNSRVESIHNSIRVFRNLPTMRYRYNIHETLFNGDKTPSPFFIPDNQCKIMHTGYVAELNRTKLLRNLPYLQNETRQTAGNPLALYYLAESFLLTKQYSKAVTTAREFCNQGVKFFKNDLAADLLLIKALFHQPSNPAEILELSQKALSKHPDHPQLIKAVADCYFLIKNYNQAEIFYKQSLIANQNYSQDNQEVNNYPSEMIFVYHNLAQIAYHRQYYAVADKYIRQALKEDRYQPICSKLLLNIFRARNFSEAKITELLIKEYDPKCLEDVLFILPLLIDSRIISPVVYYLNKSGINQSEVMHISLLAFCLRGDFSLAINQLKSNHQLARTEDYAYLAILLILLGKLEKENFQEYIPQKILLVLDFWQKPASLTGRPADLDLLNKIGADLIRCGFDLEELVNRFSQKKEILTKFTNYLQTVFMIKEAKTVINLIEKGEHHA